jgi:hypothetical protein
VHGWVADYASSTIGFGFASLELWFDQGDYPGMGREERHNSWQNQA